jgi:competence protein ComEC
MGWGLEAIIAIARNVASWPSATLPVPPMPGWGLLLFSLGLAWLCLWRTRLRLAGIVVMLAGLLSPVLSPMPDVLVSDDARLIALRDGGGYRLQARSGAPGFVRDSWREHLALADWLPLGPGCDPDGCRVGGALLLREPGRHEPSPLAPDCAGVQIVISAEPARGVCPGAALLDRFTVWRDGAHAVWLNLDGPVVLSSRADRGVRPWVPPPPVSKRRTPNLPMAPTEALPAATEE